MRPVEGDRVRDRRVHCGWRRIHFHTVRVILEIKVIKFVTWSTITQRQTDRQTDRMTDRQTDRQTDRDTHV